MKIKTLVIIILSILFACIVYTMIGSYSNFKSFYDLGYKSGYMFGKIMIILLPILIGLYLILKLKNKYHDVNKV